MKQRMILQSAISMIFWAEKILCFFDNEPGNLKGTECILRNVDRLPDKREEIGLTKEKEVEILPIISRVPHFLSEKQENELQKKISKSLRIRELNNCKEIFTLHSDPDIEIESSLIIPPEGEIKKTQLLNEYLKLISIMYPEVVGDKKGDEASVHLWKALDLSGSPGEIDETYRVFRLQNTQGIMINLSDNQKNVSFKVDTFCAILNDIHKCLIKETDKETDKNSEKVENSFYRSGFIAGNNFGKSLMEKAWNNSNEMTVEDKLDSWCRFDSSVGFGFMAKKSLKKDGVNVLSGKIVVKNNFLANNRGKDEISLCSLFAGYIAGVLKEILGFEVKVEHPKSLCMRLTKGRKSCDFYFSRK